LQEPPVTFFIQMGLFEYFSVPMTWTIDRAGSENRRSHGTQVSSILHPLVAAGIIHSMGKINVTLNQRNQLPEHPRERCDRENVPPVSLSISRLSACLCCFCSHLPLAPLPLRPPPSSCCAAARLWVSYPLPSKLLCVAMSPELAAATGKPRRCRCHRCLALHLSTLRHWSRHRRSSGIPTSFLWTTLVETRRSRFAVVGWPPPVAHCRGEDFSLNERTRARG
jgi:hypothetical protein